MNRCTATVDARGRTINKWFFAGECAYAQWFDWREWRHCRYSYIKDCDIGIRIPITIPGINGYSVPKYRPPTPLIQSSSTENCGEH